MAYQTTCRRCNKIWTSDVKAKECPKCMCQATGLLESRFDENIVHGGDSVELTSKQTDVDVVTEIDLASEAKLTKESELRPKE